MSKIIALVCLFLTFNIPYAFAACSTGTCPFTLELTPLKKLKTNAQISDYQIHKSNAHKANAKGTLSDGSKLEITLIAGDVWSRIDRKIMPTPTSTPALSDQEYWLNEALKFAHIIWPSNNDTWLQDAIKTKQFPKGKIDRKQNRLTFEKYTEGNFTRITVIKEKQQVIIELQQSSC